MGTSVFQLNQQDLKLISEEKFKKIIFKYLKNWNVKHVKTINGYSESTDIIYYTLT